MLWSRAVLGQSTILTLSAQTWAMFRLHTLTDGIASRMLARHGISAVWQLQVAAAIVYRTGNRTAAECILEMADAAERDGGLLLVTSSVCEFS